MRLTHLLSHDVPGVAILRVNVTSRHKRDGVTKRMFRIRSLAAVAVWPYFSGGTKEIITETCILLSFVLPFLSSVVAVT